MDFCTKYYLKREPPLAQSSITNYCGLIRNLYKKLNMEFDDIKDLSVVADADKVFKIQETMGSFFVETQSIKRYPGPPVSGTRTIHGGYQTIHRKAGYVQ